MPVAEANDKKEWLKKIEYLNDPEWKEKKLLPLDQNKFPLNYDRPDTEIIYDFEVQNNIYSVSAFYKQLHKLIIWYHVDEGTTVNEEEVVRKAHAINDMTINTYPDQFDGKIKLECRKMTVESFRQIFERPKRYVVGFNSNFYDLAVAAYILAYIYHSPDGRTFPETHEMRVWNNLLINPVDEIKSNLTFQKELRELHITPSRRMRLYEIASIFDNAKPYQRLRFIGYHGTVPYINFIYRLMMNTGLHLDMKLLNAKDKDTDTGSGPQYTSLKRIAGQLGYQIEEPEEVDLSSNGDLNEDQRENLLAYNASDVLITTLIFQTKDYQNVLSTREGLLNRFDKDRFKGNLNVNSTSAKSVENVIAPTEKDRRYDQIDINYFYPVHGKQYQKYQDMIDKDFVNKTVPYVSPDKKRLAFDQWCNYYSDYRKLNEQARNKIYEDPLIRQKFEDEYSKNVLHGLRDRDYLDNKWTKFLRAQKGFGPVKKPDGEMIQRFRVKYGEIQEDLLEHARLKFPKFPKAAYNLYDCYRGTKSILDENGELIEPARKVGTQKFVEKYLPICGRQPTTKADEEKGILGKPIPPKDTYYEYRKDHTVKGIRVVVKVPERPMCLVYSVGGVHGEVMKQEAYDRDLKYVEEYNGVLNKIKDVYPNATGFVQDLEENNLPDNLKQLFTLDYSKQESEKKAFRKELHDTQTMFTTRRNVPNKGAFYEYKSEKSVPYPKDYVIPIDMHDAVHVDVDSLYPSLMINLHMFSKWTSEYNDPNNFNETDKIGHWDDVYAKLRAQRVALKKKANSVPKEDWGPEQYHEWAIQLINKLLLNSASGIADGSWKTKVLMNNKAASMRIMGQLALTYLIYTVEPKGVYSTSTNTDGVYLTSNDKNFSEKDINAEIEHWKERHHLGATPEIMSHFVSKDANNRFEKEHPDDPGAPAGGTIGNAFGASSSSKMSQPFVIDAGLVNYFETHKNICTTYKLPTDDFMKFLKKQQSIILNAKEYNEKVRNAMLSFCWPMQPAKSQIFVLKREDGILATYLPVQHVNRVVIVKKGFKLEAFKIQEKGNVKNEDDELTAWCKSRNLIDKNDLISKAYRTKISKMKPDWHVLRLNLELKTYFKSDVWKNLDLKAYCDFMVDRILGTADAKGRRTKPIWVEPEFKKPRYAEKLEKILTDFQ